MQVLEGRELLSWIDRDMLNTIGGDGLGELRVRIYRCPATIWLYYRESVGDMNDKETYVGRYSSTEVKRP